MPSSEPPGDRDDPHLEISVLPAKSAFYAGEPFSCVITFTNTRWPRIVENDVPRKASRHGRGQGQSVDLRVLSGTGGLSLEPDRRPMSPTSPRTAQAVLQSVIPRGPSLARLGQVGKSTAKTKPRNAAPPHLHLTASSPHLLEDAAPSIRSPDPQRMRQTRALGNRSRSVALGGGNMSPQELVWALSNQAGSIPKAHPHSRKVSVVPPLPSPTTPSTAEGWPPAPTPSPTNSGLFSIEEGQTSPRPSISPSQRATPPPTHRRPSYMNAYGAGSLGLGRPAAPQARFDPPGTTTILWAHTRLRATFTPSTQHIPPDPLLPLRSLLLHQPLGSGQLQQDGPKHGSKWSFNFGTGAIGQQTNPSLTGSLFGLAKGLVGSSGGTLEEERRRVWAMKELPVLEGFRSLIGVDLTLKEGESKAYRFEMQLPHTLPPTYRGKAFKFGYDLCVSINVALPGPGKRQRNKEIVVPVRVWSNVSLANPLRTYDVLQPIIQRQDKATVIEYDPLSPTETPASVAKNDDLTSLQSYARHLIDATATPERHLRALSPSSHRPAQVGALSPGARRASTSSRRRASYVEGDDELVVGTEGGCGQAVEILSSNSQKSSFDIAKNGEVVAVLTLVKTAYRLGETVLGVVSFNEPRSHRRVLKFSAYLETTEIIPEALRPPGPQPNLDRTHAEHTSSLVLDMSRLSFSLDIPSDATPAFSLAAGQGGKGGVRWRIRLVFLVASPSGAGAGRHEPVHLVPGRKPDGDNISYTALDSLAPVLQHHHEWRDMLPETVECDVPISVLAGNTAFLVRPSIQHA